MEIYFNTLLDKARKYAKDCHESTNHKYDGKPYSTHLQMVYEFGLKYIDYFDSIHHSTILAACWTHDVIEDCRQTYNDVKKATSETVAEITFALTNEKGKSRKERANAQYYFGIARTPFATFVKLCDRLANVKYSKDNGGSMFKVYQKENEAFQQLIWNSEYKEMFDELDELLK